MVQSSRPANLSSAVMLFHSRCTQRACGALSATNGIVQCWGRTKQWINLLAPLPSCQGLRSSANVSRARPRRKREFTALCLYLLTHNGKACRTTNENRYRMPILRRKMNKKRCKMLIICHFMSIKRCKMLIICHFMSIKRRKMLIIWRFMSIRLGSCLHEPKCCTIKKRL